MVCVAYPLTYCAPHVALLIVVIHSVVLYLRERRFPSRLLIAAPAGLTLGFLVHPHFPAILRVWYVQNVEVLYHAFAGTPGLNLGGELGPPTADVFVKECPLLLAVGAAILFFALFRGRRLETEALSTLVIAAGFLGLTCLSKRFAEYSVPFVTLFAAMAYKSIAADFRAALPRVCRGIVGFTFALALVFVYRSAAKTREAIASTGVASLKPAAIWLRDHSQPGDIVFTSNWDEFPELFFYNARNHYLVALDPTFMRAHDRRIFEIWTALRIGERKDLYNQLRGTFNARYLLVGEKFAALSELARSDPRLRQVFGDETCTIFEVRP